MGEGRSVGVLETGRIFSVGMVLSSDCFSPLPLPSSSFSVFAWVGNVSGTVVIKTVGAAVNGSSLMVRSICSLSSLLFSLSGITVGKKCLPNFISNTEGRGSSESLVETSLIGICWGGYEIF